VHACLIHIGCSHHEGAKIPLVHINKQSTMINNHRVVHTIHLFVPIEPQLVIIIIPRLVNLYENPINEFNTTLESWDVLCKGNALLSSRSSNLVTYGPTNAWCNKYCIIKYYTLALIPHECIIHEKLLCLKNMMNYNQCCFALNLIGHFVTMWVTLMDFAWA
jgi:hypothetical protein